MSCSTAFEPDVVPAPRYEAHRDAQTSLDETAKPSCQETPNKPIADPEASTGALERFYALSSKENQPPDNTVPPGKPRVCENSAD